MKISGIKPIEGLDEIATLTSTLAALEELLYDYEPPKLAVEIDLEGVQKYAAERNCSVLDLLPEEKSRFIWITKE